MANSQNLINTDAGATDNSDKLYVECVKTVYQLRSQNLISHIFISGLPLYLGWTNEAWFTNFSLLFLLWAYIMVGYYSTYSFNSSLPNDEKTKRWGNALFYQIAFVGILYNLIFLNLNSHGVENAMIYLLLITALFSAGAVSSYQHMKWLGPLFVITAMTPQCLYYLTSPNTGDVLFAFLVAVFIVFMTNIGLNLHKNAVYTLSLNHELTRAKEQAEKLARTDMLTGLNNRRAFFDTGKVILENARRYEHPLSVVMLDIDKFKLVNDTYGHATGDEVIREVANALRKIIRASDVPGRLGGEEFAVILQETNLAAAKGLAERLRKEVQRILIHFEGHDISVTASFGVAQHGADCDTLDGLIANADIALYQAKEEGRNRVIVAKDA